MTEKKWRAVILSTTLLSLSAGLLLKSPCLYRDWGPPRYIQYRTLCYSDLQPLYGLRGLDRKRIPYVEEKSYEYPAFIALEMWTASFFAKSHVSFFLANVPFLAAAALAASWALASALRRRPARVLLFSLGPPLIFYSFHNWDLMAVAPLALSAWAWSRGRTVSAGALLGVGASAKLFPGFGVPALGIGVFDRSRRPSRTVELAVAALGGWAVVNAPFVILELLKDGSIKGWLAVFGFHARRFPDFGTVWYWWPEWMAHAGNRSSWAGLLPVGVWTGGSLLVAAAAFLYYRKNRTTILAPLGVGIVFGLGLLVILALRTSPIVSGGPTTAEYKGFVDTASLFGFALGSLFVIIHQLRSRKDPWSSFAAIVCLFLLVSKVHSPQYALWLLVFFVVVETPWPLMAAYFASDALLLASGFWWFADSPTLGPSGWRTVFIISVYLRAIALGSLLVWYLTGARDLVEFGARSSPVDLKAEMAAGSPKN